MTKSKKNLPSLLKAEETLLAELERRKRARASLAEYTMAIDVPGRPASDDPEEWLFNPIETAVASHHMLILDTMQKVIEGELPRAMFFLPPGSAKSTYCSTVAPTWAMGRKPGTKIILTSYGSDLAKKHGRRARQIVKSDDFLGIFNTSISKETSAADEWALENGSEYMAGGILSGITGNRAHGLIIDDPVKGREEADSAAIQNKTWDAYNDDLRTRLIPGGWEIIVQTRWSENDLSGKLLPEDYNGESGLIRCRDGRDWYVLCIPAECTRKDDPLGREIGELLWPEWFTPDHFAGFRAQPRTWSALFQQSPAPEEGTYFQREWFNFYRPGEYPGNLHTYQSTDFGVTDGDGDPTELGVFGLNPADDIYVLDWWSGQTTADVWIDRLLDQVVRFGPLATFGESGVIRRAVEPFLKKRMQERNIYTNLEWIPRVNDKVVSARGFQARASQRKVYLPDNKEGHDLLDELLKFPAGSRDNKVDACALFGMALDQAHPSIAPREADNRPQTAKRIDELLKPQQDPSMMFDDYSPWDMDMPMTIPTIDDY